MTKKWSSILLSLSAASILFGACTKNKFSNDDPLPASYSPSVIINSDNQVMYAYNPTDGKKHWEQSFAYLPHVPNTRYTPSPLCYNGKIYLVAVNSDTLYKLDSRTGAIVQRIQEDYEPYKSIATPTAEGSMIYIAGLNGTIYAVDTNGELKWKYATGFSFESSPVIYKENIYVANTNGHVFAIDKVNGPDPATNNIVWDFPGAGVTSTAKFVSSITVGDPYLYVGSISDSNMYCIYITPPVFEPPIPPVPPYYGFLRWTYKTNGAILSSPAAYGGYCFFGSNDNNVYCLDTSIQPFDPIAPTYTPRAVWKFRTSSQVTSSPLASGQVVYIGSNDQNLYAINIINGSQKWKCATNGLIKSSPALYGKNVFIGSYDKNLYAVDTATGTVRWYTNVNGSVGCSPAVDNLSAMFGFNSQISGLTN